MRRLATARTAAVVAAGALWLGAGIGVAGLASADPSASPSTSQTSGTSTERADLGRRGHHIEVVAEGLAEKLGVSETKVTEALQSLRDELKPADRPAPGERPDPAARDAQLAKDVAEKLGISEEKVKSALDGLRAERQADRKQEFTTRLDDAVKAGTLTQAEADAVLKAAEKGVIGMGGRGPR